MQKILPILAPNEIKTPEEFTKMPKEYRDIAVHLMLVHTEGELTGADDYTQIFYNLAPDSYEKTVCCERAIEEIQHYQLGAQVLKDIGVDTNYMLTQTYLERPLYANELVRGVRNWSERGIFSWLGESVVLEHLLELKDCSYMPFSEIFNRQIIKDEHIHVAHGYRIIRDQCKSSSGLHDAQVAINRLWPHILGLFGHDASARSKLYRKWGFRKTSNNELRTEFVKKMTPKLNDLGLEIPI